MKLAGGIFASTVPDLFPSPCGEEVMKSTIASSLKGTLSKPVSVPLRGRGHEMNRKLIQIFDDSGFRPLAGKRS